jgi:hypothetical protein
MAKQTFHGSCKCGAVKFEAKLDLSKGTSKCNCTSCWKRRWWSAKVETDDFKALAGADKLTKDTSWNFCSGCGVVPYVAVEAAEWNDGAYVSINVATLDDLDPKQLMESPIQLCDGRNDDWWHEPAFSKHL